MVNSKIKRNRYQDLISMKTVIYNSTPITPSKIICIGRNYVEHISELNNDMPTSMVIFNKPNSAITDRLFYINDSCHFEAEISFVINDGKIAGVALGLDLTNRQMQSFLKEKGLPWERAKSFDNSAVFSHFHPLSERDKQLWFELYINNTLVQQGSEELMIYKPEEILLEVQSFMTIFEGDILMTGTPKGVGPYKKGDIFSGKLYSKSNCLIDVTWTVE